ncbi:MAG TPA: plastocyanin/azurin family copper-binding protein [Solirubrobacteraceae bacterium]|nr:plastocyanin/azurin family copper-binding protein [Solirubrobacteraceae bacterium]
MGRLRKGVLAAVLVLGASAAIAYADQTIYAGPPTQFIGGNITISQGEKVTFTNVDVVTHDVTAQSKGPDGKAAFASAHTDPGGSQPVVGTEYLTTGSYQYICSIHPYMTGTITVTSNGTPAPRPGAGTGGSAAPPATASSSSRSDVSIQVQVLDSKLAAVRKRHALQLSVSADRPATIGLVARVGKTIVASGTARISQAGSTTVSLKLTKAGAKLVKRVRTLTLSVSARAADSGASTSTAGATKKLR